MPNRAICNSHRAFCKISSLAMRWRILHNPFLHRYLHFSSASRHAACNREGAVLVPRFVSVRKSTAHCNAARPVPADSPQGEIRRKCNDGHLCQTSRFADQSGPGRQWNPDLVFWPCWTSSFRGARRWLCWFRSRCWRGCGGRPGRVRMDLRIIGPPRLPACSQADGPQAQADIAGFSARGPNMACTDARRPVLKTPVTAVTTVDRRSRTALQDTSFR